MNTNKKHIKNVAKICAAKGIRHAVISPGSRCAPLTVAFSRQPEIECISIVDERSAAFFALGIAQQSLQPVVLICTSGSAVLNYAPALAEAYYQKIPLLVITADRPNEWIDQGENQSIQQYEVYKNYIKRSFSLPLQISEEKDLWYSDRIVSEAIHCTFFPDFGPVHINVPLREPLYELEKDTDKAPKIISFPAFKPQLDKEELKKLSSEWNASTKKMIVVGSQKKYNAEIEEVLNNLSSLSDVIILKEAIANVNGENLIGQIDPLIEQITKKNLTNFVPEIVLTFGGSVVSKKLKFWLRKQQPKAHWHVTKSYEHFDNFQSLSKVLQTDSLELLNFIEKNGKEQTSAYKNDWLTLRNETAEKSEKYMQNLSFCDFSIYDFLLKNLPKNANIQLGNSTPIRYVNLLQIKTSNQLIVNSNRGVSGIDGSSSTSSGSAYFNKDKTTILISGDVSFMYDSNALWNNYNLPNFKIVVVNNSGGNIFKIIPGPDQLEELEKYFETHQNISVKPLAEMHHFAYFSATDFTNLKENYSAFLKEKKQPAILEIFTNNNLSADALKNYFDFILA